MGDLDRRRIRLHQGCLTTANQRSTEESRFNYGGQFTSESNARFDVWLKSRDPNSGVRDFEALDRLAQAQGLRLERDVAMPSNNRTLIWRRHSIP